MKRRFSRKLRGVAGWLVHRPVMRLTATCILWSLVIVALAYYADPLVWLSLLLGILLPVSLWIAWNDSRFRRNDTSTISWHWPRRSSSTRWRSSLCHSATPMSLWSAVQPT